MHDVVPCQADRGRPPMSLGRPIVEHTKTSSASSAMKHCVSAPQRAALAVRQVGSHCVLPFLFKNQHSERTSHQYAQSPPPRGRRGRGGRQWSMRASHELARPTQMCAARTGRVLEIIIDGAVDADVGRPVQREVSRQAVSGSRLGRYIRPSRVNSTIGSVAVTGSAATASCKRAAAAVASAKTAWRSTLVYSPSR